MPEFDADMIKAMREKKNGEAEMFRVCWRYLPEGIRHRVRYEVSSEAIKNKGTAWEDRSRSKVAAIEEMDDVLQSKSSAQE